MIAELGIRKIDDPAEHIEFLAVLDFDIGLFDLGNGQLGVLDPDKLGLIHEPLGYIDDRLRHGCREEEGLPGSAGLSLR